MWCAAKFCSVFSSGAVLTVLVAAAVLAVVASVVVLHCAVPPVFAGAGCITTFLHFVGGTLFCMVCLYFALLCGLSMLLGFASHVSRCWGRLPV